MTVYLVHGFNSEKHAVWMAEIGEILKTAGYEIVRSNYGHVGLFGVGSKTEEVARDLAASACPGDVAVGHSNGCTAIHRALDFGAGFGHLLFFNAALPTDATFMPWVDRVDVFHAANEIATAAGGLWASLNPWAANWGAMGRYGYEGRDGRVSNFALGPVGHSGALAFPRRARTAEAIQARIRGEAVPRQPLFRS